MPLVPYEERLRRYRDHEANKKKPGRPKKIKPEPYEKLYNSDVSPDLKERFTLSEDAAVENPSEVSTEEPAIQAEEIQEQPEILEAQELKVEPEPSEPMSQTELALKVAERAAGRVLQQNHRAWPPESPAEKWYPAVTEFMARNPDCTLPNAARICARIELSKNEETMHWRRRTFQKMLLSAKGHYYAALGKDPIKSKNAVVGRMLWLVDKLVEAGDFEKAGELLFKVGKAEGYIGPEIQMNNFYGVTDQELEAAREKLLVEIGVQDIKSLQKAGTA